MKNIKYIIALFLLIYSATAFAQRKCGIEGVKAALIAKDPAWAAKLEAQRGALQSIGDHYKALISSTATERETSTVSPIPVIFHIAVSSSQLAYMGGTSGILQRIDSQIAVLNRDFNRQNADSSMIPSSWKSLYASTGIHFGLAHTAPNGYGSYGYELRITDGTPDAAGFNENFTYNDYTDAKDSTYGLAAWDNTKYMNVWVINFADNSGLLGVTIPKSYTGGAGVPPQYEGVCMNYLALGTQTSTSSLNFIDGTEYDLGRTLTHEAGHFFEIWHTWGDDGGSCPWSGGRDDGIADTPPEGDAHYGTPTYTIAGGTLVDDCQYDTTTDEQPIGVPCLDFINYVDDGAMHMYTTDQAAVMAAMVLIPSGSGTGARGMGLDGENYSLTQNPSLLDWPADAGVVPVSASTGFSLFPNPTSGIVNISYDATSDQLQLIVVTNMLGQDVKTMDVSGQKNNSYSVDLSGMGAGIYFVRCNFLSGTITRKVVLQ
jgi:hypothetical protein